MVGPNQISSLTFSPDGKMVAMGMKNGGGVEIWSGGKSPANWRRMQTFPVKNETFETIVALAFSPDGKVLASEGEHGTIWLRKVGASAGKEELAAVKREGEPGTYGLAFSPNGRLLASGCSNGDVLLWDAVTCRQLPSFRGSSSPIRVLTFSLDGEVLAAGCEDGAILIWSMLGHVRKFPARMAHRPAVTALAFSPDGKRLISCTQDGSVKLWETAGGELLTTLVGGDFRDYPQFGKWPGSLVVGFARDGRTVAAVQREGFLRLWPIASGKDVP
jgi:WD40 repeat protein